LEINNNIKSYDTINDIIAVLKYIIISILHQFFDIEVENNEDDDDDDDDEVEIIKNKYYDVSYHDLLSLLQDILLDTTCLKQQNQSCASTTNNNEHKLECMSKHNTLKILLQLKETMQFNNNALLNNNIIKMISQCNTIYWKCYFEHERLNKEKCINLQCELLHEYVLLLHNKFIL